MKQKNKYRIVYNNDQRTILLYSLTQLQDYFLDHKNQRNSQTVNDLLHGIAGTSVYINDHYILVSEEQKYFLLRAVFEWIDNSEERIKKNKEAIDLMNKLIFSFKQQEIDWTGY